MPRPRRTLTLSAAEEHKLINARDHDPHPDVRERCAALVQIAAGQSPHAVARHELWRPRDPDTVYGWLNRYAAEGLTGLQQHRHGGPRRRGP